MPPPSTALLLLLLLARVFLRTAERKAFDCPIPFAVRTLSQSSFLTIRVAHGAPVEALLRLVSSLARKFDFASFDNAAPRLTAWLLYIVKRLSSERVNNDSRVSSCLWVWRGRPHALLRVTRKTRTYSTCVSYLFFGVCVYLFARARRYYRIVVRVHHSRWL